MLDGAETYLQIWERGTYGGGGDCVKDGSTLQAEDLHALLGGNLEGFLEAAGAPVSRDGAAYVYCVEEEDGHLSAVSVAFDDAGRASGITAAPAAVVERLGRTAPVAPHVHDAAEAVAESAGEAMSGVREDGAVLTRNGYVRPLR